ncbi:MAG: YhdT family protein [Eggerthellaceae bacterium]|nr:YhdT family protein [Eggerthellaceae bacterium]
MHVSSACVISKGREMLTYRQKHEQANREAIATIVALVVTIVVWIVCGFGLSGLDVTLFHTPLWVIGGTVGTWICSIVVVVVLAKRFFVGFDLDEDDDSTSLEAKGEEHA